MSLVKRNIVLQSVAVLTSTLLLLTPAFGQDYPPPPSFAPGQLDNLVGRIALYPDPLLAQILAAATFPDQIQDAAGWADQNRYLRGDDLANAINQSNLPWDPSVQALLPFPNVLDMMAGDMDWTSQLGNAVLAQRPDVMDAVQRMRHRAYNYGYLRTGPQIRVVDDGGWVEVLPVNAGYVVVPTYDPYIVYAAPRPGFFVGGAIGFGAGFYLGASFGAWGWGGGFDWRAHNVFVHNVAWGRTWVNRGSYVHNYGNWAGGNWRNTVVNRNVNVNRSVNINRNVDINRNGNGYRNSQGPTRNVYNGNQRFSVAPSRGYEQHSEPEHTGAFHGTENGRSEHAAAAWGQASRGGGGNRGGNEHERGGHR